MHWVKQVSAWFLLLHPSQWFLLTRPEIFYHALMKDCGDQSQPQFTMKAALSLGRRTPAGGRLWRLTLAISVILCVTSVASQDSDCTWKPQSEVEEGVAALECDLKTLQTGPTSLPQVRSQSVSQSSLCLNLGLMFGKFFYLIWQFTNVVICFSSGKKLR